MLKRLSILLLLFPIMLFAQDAEIVRAQQLFSTDIFPSGTISFSSLSTDCLRTGYQFEKKRIVFCSSDKVIHGGKDSKDVIHHEAFHAMLCQLRPNWCTSTSLASDEAITVHEALADFFASHLDDNETFGEGFYHNFDWIRSYQNSLCYSLTSNSYLQAGALNRYWANHQIELKDFKNYLLNGELNLKSLREYGLIDGVCFFDKSSIIPIEQDLSPLHRYRIPLEGAMFRLDISHNVAKEVAPITLNLINNNSEITTDFTLKSEGLDFFLIPSNLKVRGRYYLQMKDQRRNVVGLMPLYLSVRKINER